MRHSRVRFLLALLLIPASIASAEAMPGLVQHNGQFSFLVNGKPYLVLGAQVHNSSGWPQQMNALWPMLTQLHANTVMVPVYWQAIEPTPGQFDFSSLGIIVNGARQNGLRLALLWFGTWSLSAPHVYQRMAERAGRLSAPGLFLA